MQKDHKETENDCDEMQKDSIFLQNNKKWTKWQQRDQSYTEGRLSECCYTRTNHADFSSRFFSVSNERLLARMGSTH